MTRQYIQKRKLPTPVFYCESCEKCISGYCSFYERRVNTNFNRCFNHSNYHTVATKYQSPENITEIALNREKQNV